MGDYMNIWEYFDKCCQIVFQNTCISCNPNKFKSLVHCANVIINKDSEKKFFKPDVVVHAYNPRT